MAVVDDFVNPQLIFEGRFSQLFRAWCVQRSCKVLLKVCRTECPGKAEMEMFRREFGFHSRIDHPGIFKALALEQTSLGLSLIFEDNGGDYLKRVCERLSPSKERLLAWFQDVAHVLAYCHGRGIFHGHLTPYVIVVDTLTDRLQLTSFDSDNACVSCDYSDSDAEYLLLTLAYGAPELKRDEAVEPDARSDLYSLGVIMYEAFSGRLPFESDTASGLLHSHAAVVPLPPSRHCPDIPGWLDDIILSLLEKVPSRRIASAERLEELLAEGIKTGRLTSTGMDMGEGPGFSDEICCRDTDKARLSDWLRELDGQGHLPGIWPKSFLLHGEAGVGKTSLARWGLRHLVQHHPRVLKVGVKFDQETHSCGDVFVQVVGQVVKMILSESEEVLASWRNVLNDVMGQSAAHLAAIVPEFGLLSRQAPVAYHADSDGVAATHQLMMDRFFSAFSRMGRPLLIFVDDLQWADEDSAQFFLAIQQMGMDRVGLLFTLRSGEPLARNTEILVSFLKSSEGSAVQPLSHFTMDEVCTFLAMRLMEEPQRIAPLASLLYTRTGGNPFYLQTLFARMIQEGRLFKAHGVSGEAWHWDMSALNQIPLCDSVAMDVAQTLEDLSPEQKELVEAAALLGHRVPFNLLGLMLETSREVLEKDVAILCEKRVFDRGEGVLFFSHDLIQRAAYDRIPASRREAAHFHAGMRIYEGLGRRLDGHLFDIVHQFNATHRFPMRESYRSELVQLNVAAGRRSMETSAFGRALDYFRHGIRFMGERGWDSDYPRAMSLVNQAAEAAYATGDYSAMRAYTTEMEERAVCMEDCLGAFRLQVKGAIAENHFAEGLRIGMDALRKMGFTFPAGPLNFAIGRCYLKVYGKLRRLDAGDHESLPEMTDARHLAVMELCFCVTMAAYLEGSAIFFYLVLKALAYTFRHGRSRHMPFLLAGYGFIRICLFKNYDKGHAHVMQSLAMLGDGCGSGVASRTLTMAICVVRHWKEPVHDLLPEYRTAYEKARGEGEIEYAGSALSAWFYTRFFASDALDALAIDMKRYRREMSRFGLPFERTVANLQQLVFNLMTGGSQATVFAGPLFDESRQVETGVSHEDHIFALNYHITKATVLLFYGREDEALEHVLQYDALIDRSASTFTIPVFSAIVACVCARNGGKGGDREQRELIKRAGQIRRELKKQAEACPYNYTHLYEMVCGEMEMACGSLRNAIHHFELASEEALRHHFTGHAALATEVAGRCYLKFGRKRLAQICLTDAVTYWRLWGAEGKARQVEASFQTLFPGLIPHRQNQRQAEGELGADVLDVIDFQGVSQDLEEALSSQRSYEEMLTKILEIALKSGGADRGAVCSVDGDQVRMEVCTVDGKEGIQVAGARSLDDSSEFPTLMIHYAARCGKNLIYNHGEGSAFQDPYFNRFSAGGAVCIPSVVKSEIKGVVYLENSMMEGLFKGRRLNMLQVLSSQMGIAMDNTRLYESMKEQAGKLQMVNRVLQNEIADRRTKEVILKEKEQELEESGEKLKEANITLKKMLSKSDENMCEIQENMLRNVEDLITPYMERLKSTRLTRTQENLVFMLEKNVEDILSPFARKLNAEFHRLTPAEIQAAQLVRSGKTTKEIAELLNLSPRTIDAYRDSIREKLGLKKSGINLRAYLMQL